MAVRLMTVGAPTVDVKERAQRRRARRWSFFQTFFGLMYAGIVADIITTAMGVHAAGSAYEQNPIGVWLIAHAGWPGIFVLVTLLSTFCFLCVRVVFWRMSTAWSAIINPVIFILATFRWLVVCLAVAFLLNTGT